MNTDFYGLVDDVIGIAISEECDLSVLVAIVDLKNCLSEVDIFEEVDLLLIHLSGFVESFPNTSDALVEIKCLFL